MSLDDANKHHVEIPFNIRYFDVQDKKSLQKKLKIFSDY